MRLFHYNWHSTNILIMSNRNTKVCHVQPQCVSLLSAFTFVVCQCERSHINVKQTRWKWNPTVDQQRVRLSAVGSKTVSNDESLACDGSPWRCLDRCADAPASCPTEHRKFCGCNTHTFATSSAELVTLHESRASLMYLQLSFSYVWWCRSV